MIANNRLQMATMLDDRMRRQRAKLQGSGKTADRDSSRVKTFIIEANLSEESSPGRTRKFIEDLFPRLGGGQFGAIVLNASKDDTVTTVQTAIKGDAVEAYLDFTNPRFWLLHSMSESQMLDRMVSHWVDDLPELDRAWFPVGLLDQYSQMGTLKGIGIEYNNDWTKPIDSTADDSSKFNMNLSSRVAGRVLRTMRSDHGEPHLARLSRVIVESPGATSDVRFDGKITARGRDFSEHLSVTSRIVKKYADQVRKVESEYAIRGACEDGGMVLHGSPLIFDLPVEIPDLMDFCEKMFSGSAPFRLWGDPLPLSSKMVRVQALDLHSARTMAVEVTHKFLRVYLPKGSCGNSVLRLYTNLQARYDALVKVVNGTGDLVFGF
jgi:hypothetical protein